MNIWSPINPERKLDDEEADLGFVASGQELIHKTWLILEPFDCEHMEIMQTDTPQIHGFHAHVYFSEVTVSQARQLCEAAVKLFDVRMGRMHERPVGPHPDWSCQLAFKPEVFGRLVPWLAMNRSGLVVFVHPISDNDLLDHVERAMWMGAVRPLDLSMLDAAPGEYDL